MHFLYQKKFSPLEETLAGPGSDHPWQKSPTRQYFANIRQSISALEKHHKAHQSHSKIDLVQTDRMRVPETVDSAALLQCERQAYQYNEYGGGDGQNLAETQ